MPSPGAHLMTRPEYRLWYVAERRGTLGVNLVIATSERETLDVPTAQEIFGGMLASAAHVTDPEIIQVDRLAPS